MASSSVLKSGVKQVRPLLSIDNAEARKRVLNLYKAWYRQIPYIGQYICLIQFENKLEALTFVVLLCFWHYSVRV